MIKSTLKFVALILGLGSLLFGASSCKKDDDEKCCSWTYDGEKVKYCIGDTYGDTKITDANWAEFKAYVKDYYGATCD